MMRFWKAWSLLILGIVCFKGPRKGEGSHVPCHNTDFLSSATRGVLKVLKLVPSLFWDCRLGQTPSLHHRLPHKIKSLHALNISLISKNTAIQPLKNSLQVMPFNI